MNHTANTNFVKHEPCLKCGSSDGKAVYSDGGSYCFVCESFTKGDGTMDTDNNLQDDLEQAPSHSSYSLPEGRKYCTLTDRNISKDTLKKFGVTVQADLSGDVIRHFYPYADAAGATLGYKVRTCEDKSFKTLGDIRGAGLFGQHLFSRGGKYVTITEGEIDAMSAFELTGSKYPVVSIKNGAQAALKDCKKAFDYLDSFENIIICFDSDEPGKEAARKVAELFSPKKAKIVKLDLKDAGEYLKERKHKEFTQAWWNAEAFSPPGIICGSSLKYLLEEEDTEVCYLYPWEGMNDLTYGLRMGELITITAGSGMGKTQFIRELAYHFLKNTSFNIGLAMLEESKKDTMVGLMSVAADKPLHLPKDRVHRTKDEMAKAYEETMGTGRVYLFDDDAFGSHYIDEILSKIRYLAKGFDCKIIILDHISMIVSDQRNGDERKALDEIATKLKKLTIELGVSLIMISHSKRQASKPLEEGGQTSLSDIRGTAGIGQLSNLVIGLERDGQHDDPIQRNTTTVRIVKNRFSGLTGVACHLLYDRNTGRMTEVEAQDNKTDGEKS